MVVCMNVPSFSLKTLELYLGKLCKVVYRDGGATLPAKAFYGKLVSFDPKFQVWEGCDDKKMSYRKQVAFNHDDVSRIVLEM